MKALGDVLSVIALSVALMALWMPEHLGSAVGKVVHAYREAQK